MKKGINYCIGVAIQMSNYPIWWDSGLTLYNKYTDPQTQIITWRRTVLQGCFVKSAGATVSVGNTVIETDDVLIRIRQSPKYKSKKDYISMPNDLMSNYFTLGVGDIIVFGEVDDTINEYSSGHRSSDLVAKYKELDGCIEIKQIADNTGIGRCNPHYFVRGI